MRRHHCLMASVLMLLVACGESGGDTNQNNNSTCPEGFEQSGPACIPIFDDCPGAAEISVLGGGCQAVGVTECADGFVSDGEGGCNAILPPNPCPSGTIALLGHTSCQPLGDCGTSTWGTIVDDGTTVFVDASNIGGGDGSQGSPYPTIGEAVQAVQDGGQIAIAGGIYQENVVLDRPLRLVGRCAAEVIIQGVGDAAPTVLFTVGAGDPATSIRGVTLTGEATGLQIDGAQGVSVEHVQVVDTAGMGIVLQAGAVASVRRSVVLRSTMRGLFSYGSNVDLEESVVSETRPLTSGDYGRGVQAWCHPSSGCGSLQVSSSLVSGNRNVGIFIAGVDTEVTATVVRGTLPRQSDGTFGEGISAQCFLAGACGSLRISSSLVTGNRSVGIVTIGVDTEVTETLVRDTLPRENTGKFGEGIIAECHPEFGVCGSLQVSSSLVSGNRDVGILAIGVDTEVTATVVRGTLPQQSTEMFGRGIASQCSPAGTCGTLRVLSSLVSGNRGAGIVAFGVDTEVTSSVVRDTLPEQNTGRFGRGINVQCNLDCSGREILRVSSSLVMDNENVGIFIAGVPAILEGVAVFDTHPNIQGPWQGTNGQGLWARCDEVTGDCGDLSMTSCLVDSSQTGGVAVEGVSGFIASSVVRTVLAQPLDGKYGYGVQISGLEGEDMPTFNVNDCEVRDAKLAGVLYYRARGTLSGSVVSGGENSVVMNEGSEPTILDSNDLSGTIEDEPTWANLYPSPAPPPALPLDPIE